MPSSASPPRGPRRRSPSPRRDRDRDSGRDRPRDAEGGRHERDRRDRDRDRDRDERRGGGGDRDRDHHRERERDRDAPRDRDRDRDRDADKDRSNSTTDRRRTPSPPRRSKPKTKELSFYKKSSNSSSLGSFSHRRDPLDVVEESAKERMQRREQGEVPARFGGTREQGVRNTTSTIAPSGTSARVGGGNGDPLDRMPVKGGAGNGDKMMQERVAAMGGSAPAGGSAAGPPSGIPTPRNARMIEVIANDRMGRKVRVKCLPTDTVGDLKKLIAAQTGTTHQKIQLKKWYTVYKDHVSLRDYEINDGMSLEMY